MKREGDNGIWEDMVEQVGVRLGNERWEAGWIEGP